jgi:hypothetical protein
MHTAARSRARTPHPPSPGPTPGPGALFRTWGIALLAAASIVVVAAQFLNLYLGDPVPVPAGFDTPKYIWRANLVAEEGLEALPGSTPSWFKENADRPGYPVLAGMIRATTGITAFDLSFLLPATAGVIIGLGAGAFALRGLREPSWAFGAYVVGVGASVNVGYTATGLADNLIIDALVMAAATTALMAADAQRTSAATILLFAAATLVHWPFAVVFLALLVALTVALVPESVTVARREGLLGTPAGLLGATVAGSAAAMVGALALAPALPEAPRAGAGQFIRKLKAVTPLFLFPVLAPLAGLGGVALLSPRDPARRRGMLLCLIWAGSAAVAVALLSVGVKVAAHRILVFALGIPILAVAALTGAAGWLARVSRLLRPVAAILIVAGLIGGGVLMNFAWARRARTWMPEQQLVQGEQAGQYLQRIGNQGPVIFVFNPYARDPGSSIALSFHVIRAALPANQVAHSFVYLGDPSSLTEGRPTLREGNNRFNRYSIRYWADVRPVLAERPVMLFLPAFNRGLPRDRAIGVGESIAPGVVVLRGPIPEGWSPQPPKPLIPPSAGRLITQLAVVLLVFFLVGLGWSASLLPLPWAVRVALAPALGVAALTVGGVIASRLVPGGFGGLGVVVAALVSLLGWVPALRAHLRSPL